ncbi:MAG: phage holin family protein [Clostridiales bacterium]|nr:phage holin family protein [Clostridiales bacterium]
MTYLITCAFIALDFITGLVQALATKTFASSVMREGLFHKVGSVLCVVLGLLVDYAQGFVDLGVSVPVAAAICGYICVMEAGSIIENVCKINPEIMPDKLTGFFASLKGGNSDE